MHGEVVGDRLRAAARTVRVPDFLEKADRRVRHVARRLEIVVAARRQAECDHVDARVDGLERVVACGHRLFLDRAGDAVAGLVELRLVEARLVAFVEADDPAHVGIDLSVAERGPEHRGVDPDARHPLPCAHSVDGGESSVRVLA